MIGFLKNFLKGRGRAIDRFEQEISKQMIVDYDEIYAEVFGEHWSNRAKTEMVLYRAWIAHFALHTSSCGQQARISAMETIAALSISQIGRINENLVDLTEVVSTLQARCEQYDQIFVNFFDDGSNAILDVFKAITLNIGYPNGAIAVALGRDLTDQIGIYISILKDT